MEKQKLLYQQARLHDRGAAEMVLQTISASKGETPESLISVFILHYSLEPLVIKICLLTSSLNLSFCLFFWVPTSSVQTLGIKPGKTKWTI